MLRALKADGLGRGEKIATDRINFFFVWTVCGAYKYSWLLGNSNSVQKRDFMKQTQIKKQARRKMFMKHKIWNSMMSLSGH